MVGFNISNYPKLLAVICLIFSVYPGNLSAYGGHHYGHHYGYRGYGSGVHVGVHHHSHNDTLGYVVLGLLGLYVLHEIFDNRHSNHRYPATKHQVPYPTYQYKNPPKYLPARYQYSREIDDYSFSEIAGWEALNNGNHQTAMRIFAIQSQQAPGNGIPKIGFALSAAATGELERGIWSMQKALKYDPYSLTNVSFADESKLLLDDIHSKYQQKSESTSNREYYYFMMATISYLNNDMETARKELSLSGDDKSTLNLAKLIL